MIKKNKLDNFFNNFIVLVYILTNKNEIYFLYLLFHN